MLTEPLASTADDNLLVRSNALSGDEAYLVVRYEYTPGFDEIDAMSVGGQGTRLARRPRQTRRDDE